MAQHSVNTTLYIRTGTTATGCKVVNPVRRISVQVLCMDIRRGSQSLAGSGPLHRGGCRRCNPTHPAGLAGRERGFRSPRSCVCVRAVSEPAVHPSWRARFRHCLVVDEICTNYSPSTPRLFDSSISIVAVLYCRARTSLHCRPATNLVVVGWTRRHGSIRSSREYA